MIDFGIIEIALKICLDSQNTSGLGLCLEMHPRIHPEPSRWLCFFVLTGWVGE